MAERLPVLPRCPCSASSRSATVTRGARSCSRHATTHVRQVRRNCRQLLALFLPRASMSLSRANAHETRGNPDLSRAVGDASCASLDLVHADSHASRRSPAYPAHHRALVDGRSHFDVEQGASRRRGQNLAAAQRTTSAKRFEITPATCDLTDRRTDSPDAGIPIWCDPPSRTRAGPR
jgi:hypothetical protein